MKLYIGGAYQGKREYAHQQTGLWAVPCSADEALKAQAIDAFQEIVRELCDRDEDAEAYTRRLLVENPEAVVICREVGLGVIPLDEKERHWRAQVGRAACMLAAASDEVVRVTCGIGVRLK